MWANLLPPVPVKEDEQLQSFFATITSTALETKAAQRAARDKLEKNVEFGPPDPITGQRRCPTRVVLPADAPTAIDGELPPPKRGESLQLLDDRILRSRLAEVHTRREQCADFLCKQVALWLYRPPNGKMVIRLKANTVFVGPASE